MARSRFGGMTGGEGAPSRRPVRLAAVLVANLALVGGLVAVGAAARSLGVWAEAADDLADAAAIGVSLLAIALSRRPPTRRRPVGFPNATRYAALANAAAVLVLSLLVAAGACERLAAGTVAVHGLPVVAASGVTAVVMAAGALVLGGGEADEDEGEALNRRAVLLDTAADAAAATGVAATGAVILALHGWYWLDPAVALAIAAVVAAHAGSLVVRTRAALAATAAPRASG